MHSRCSLRICCSRECTIKSEDLSLPASRSDSTIVSPVLPLLKLLGWFSSLSSPLWPPEPYRMMNTPQSVPAALHHRTTSTRVGKHGMYNSHHAIVALSMCLLRKQLHSTDSTMLMFFNPAALPPACSAHLMSEVTVVTSYTCCAGGGGGAGATGTNSCVSSSSTENSKQSTNFGACQTAWLCCCLFSCSQHQKLSGQ